MKSLIALFLFATFAFAQSPAEMKAAGEAERAARKAYDGKQYAGFLTEIQKANAARPNHPRIIYNLASAFALNGNSDAALDSLERLANMGLGYAFEKDQDFASLVEKERFKSVIAKTAVSRAAVNASTKVFHLAERGLITESVAFNAKDQSYFVSSVHQRKIVRVDATGKVSDYSIPSDGLFSVLGIKIDLARGWLWAATSAFPQMKGFAADDKGMSGIVRYDLRTGKLAKKYMLPAGGEHGLGDVVIAHDGTLYATDSVANVIYKIDAKTDEMTELVRSDLFASLQGLDISQDRKSIYVADYSKGIFRIDIATKAIVQLKPAENVTLLGIDGMYFYRGRLIAIQNGVSPNRVVSFQLSGDNIIAFKTLEANHADFLEPTTGTIIGDEFYFIANSQWPLVNEKAELATDKLRDPVVLKLDLKKAIEK